MAYVRNISDVTYNHLNLPFNGRFNDLYVDGNFYGPNITGSTGATGPTGPTGATGAQGIQGDPGPSFINEGFCVIQSTDVDYLNNPQQIRFDTDNALFGGYNYGGIFDFGGFTGKIQNRGLYIIACQVDYIHNFNTAYETMVLTVTRNGGNLIASSIFYVRNSNDIETITCVKVAALESGDIIEAYLSGPVSSDQLIGSLSFLSCQRIA